MGKRIYTRPARIEAMQRRRPVGKRIYTRRARLEAMQEVADG